jgi:hypothetical protein
MSLSIKSILNIKTIPKRIWFFILQTHISCIHQTNFYILVQEMTLPQNDNMDNFVHTARNVNALTMNLDAFSSYLYTV